MKTSIAFCIIVTLILSSCAHHKPREKSLQNYNNAVQMLAGKIAEKLKGYDRQSFFIYNANAREGEECELSRRFIGAMSNYLANRGIKIKRKELVTWGRATGQFFKVECQEVLETLASDFLIEFSLKKCPGSANCMEAGVRAIACESNVIRFSAKEAFSLKGNVADWHRQKHKLPRVKGSRENPYSDYREAANYMVGRLSCIAQNIMPDDTMHILVAKTKNTHSEVATAFSETVSFYGLEQIIVPEWLPVAIRAGDQFELGIYRKEHRELFETANLVLALDMKNAENGKLFLKAHLLALKSMEIIKNGKSKTLGAGMALPYCVCSGYASTGFIKIPANADDQLWWNYYSRALSFADAGCWYRAELDLRETIRQIDKAGLDRRKAICQLKRDGLSVIDFFPHRELGVIHYNQGRMEDAISELTTSLSIIKSSKTELYLDRARKAMIEKGQLDQRAPEIIIKSPAQPFLTNAFSVVIHGLASDDTFVRHIKVGNKEIRVDVSNQEISFRTEVQVAPGRNEIPIVVKDLIGNTSRMLLAINVDRTGPVLSIDLHLHTTPIPENSISLQGYGFDASGLAKVAVNGQDFFCDGSQQQFLIDKKLFLLPEENNLEVRAKDRAGNVTIAKIALHRKVSEYFELSNLPDTQDRMPPSIKLISDLEKERVTYFDRAFLEWNIRDNETVTSLQVNKKQILKNPGRNLYCSHLIGLNQGENTITIQCSDRSGNDSQKRIKIRREMLKDRTMGSRLRIAVIPFKRETIGTDQGLSCGFEGLLYSAICTGGRFSLVERENLQAVINERALSLRPLNAKDTAIRIGQILNADCSLYGNVLERGNSVTISARLVDTETGEVLTAVDEYGEDIDNGMLRLLAQQINLKLAEELPVVEGMVTNIAGNRFHVNLGRKTRVKNGMKLIVYEILGPVRDPRTREVIGRDIMELGKARIKSVAKDTFCAQLIDNRNRNEICQGNIVITR